MNKVYKSRKTPVKSYALKKIYGQVLCLQIFCFSCITVTNNHHSYTLNLRWDCLLSLASFLTSAKFRNFFNCLYFLWSQKYIIFFGCTSFNKQPTYRARHKKTRPIWALITQRLYKILKLLMYHTCFSTSNRCKVINAQKSMLNHVFLSNPA